MEAGRLNDELMKEMTATGAQTDRHPSSRSDQDQEQLSYPIAPSRSKGTSDLYLSTGRDVTETSVISSHCRGCTCGIWFCFITLLQAEESGRSKGHRKLDKWKAARNIEEKSPAGARKSKGKARA